MDSQKDKDNYNKVIKSLLKDKNIARAMRRKSIRTQMEKAYELKNTVTANNKKVLISHISTEEDKKLIRCLEKILIDCGFTKQEILYTSSDFTNAEFQEHIQIFLITCRSFLLTL